MPQKSLEYWVVAQLALDLGLFLLVILFICKIRTLGRLLHVAQPDGANHAEKISGLSQKIADLEVRLELWESQSMNGGSPLPQPRDGAPDRVPSFFPETDHTKSLRAQVEELAGRGLSLEHIAQQLRLQPAEVKVALDLSRLLAQRQTGPT